MPKTLPNITYDDSGNNNVIDSTESIYQLPFYKPEEYLSSIDSRTNFIKACERLIRTDNRYNAYISYLKDEIKLTHCQVLSGFDDSDCTIEMHHGPIFTLYDYCDIMIDYFLYKKWKITTFRIADIILEEHHKNNIQVVMLSTTVHEEVHAREIFININQAWGNINEFIKKYGVAINHDLIDKFNVYLDKSMMMDSNSYDILKVSDRILNS